LTVSIRRVVAKLQDLGPENSGQLYKALSHELRVEILTYLTEHGPASASEMARDLKEEVADVSHHVKQLVKYGFVEVLEVRPVPRGTPVKVYRAIRRPLFFIEEVERLPSPVRGTLAGQVFQASLDDAAEGFAADAFGRRSDWHLTRTPMELDKKGWQEIRALHQETLQRTFEIQEKSGERRAESGETALRVSSTQLCYVIPKTLE
jgi:DNA-binding transcriptional ArsR family regulator